MSLDRSLDPLAAVDPWAALRDARLQLIAAVEGLSAEELDVGVSVDGLDLRLAEAIALHAAWDALHRDFFARFAAGEAHAEDEPQVADVAVQETVEAAIGELDGARREMLEAAAALDAGRYEERVASPWDAAVIDSIRGYLVAMAMRDGILAEAIVLARAEARASGQGD